MKLERGSFEDTTRHGAREFIVNHHFASVEVQKFPQDFPLEGMDGNRDHALTGVFYVHDRNDALEYLIGSPLVRYLKPIEANLSIKGKDRILERFVESLRPVRDF